VASHGQDWEEDPDYFCCRNVPAAKDPAAVWCGALQDRMEVLQFVKGPPQKKEI